jgi:AmpD protein|tara:strand:+ start:7792 stop:8343 length:552 start_codon:yes stop_codon:yes gene_type:complete
VVEQRYTVNKGILIGATQSPSDNFNLRPAGDKPSLLVIHNISLPPGQFGTGCIDKFFTNCLDTSEHPFFAKIAELTVSAHLVIDRAGWVTQYVNFNDSAWHAGISNFEGCDACNDFSIGIELEGTDNIAYTDEQYTALFEATTAIKQAYPAINDERIVGHCDIAPGRKTDPGESFDWSRYKDG